MLHYIEEHRKYVEINGFRGASFACAEAYLKENRRRTGQVTIQLFDADLVATWEHLYFAVFNALGAFRGRTNIAKTVAVESMLYASAERQIQRAIDKVGIKPQTVNVAVVLLGDEMGQVEAELRGLAGAVGCVPDDSVLGLTVEKQRRIRRVFGVSAAELKVVAGGDSGKALVDVIVEHVALLATEQ